MGSGCSSPLKRFGVKRSKPARRESSPYDIGGEQANDDATAANDARTIDNRATQEQPKSALADVKPCEFVIENEITVHSEIDDDHPSATSCCTNGQNAANNGEAAARTSEHSTTLDPKSTTSAAQTPALSPAPSSCYTPSQRIFTIRDNHRHIIAIYPDKDMLSVWDIYEEKPVRTLKNLDQPRDLRMIDQKRAVILCNRELRVYDLDSGNMLTKLKGVMNQKMPFFEVFGENYVVALARNRMYVNMLNLNTGELETTFKVGEDRFLNSLLVSSNGGICVCGDETQKPFPLLVWNLYERRLLYDLRLEGHEFLTRMSAISDDGHFVVSVCKQCGGDNNIGSGSGSASASLASHTPQTPGNSSSSSSPGPIARKSSPNFLVVYDLSSGTLFQKWDPGLDSCGVAICLKPPSRSGYVINTIVDNSILVWDLATGSKKHTLLGHSAPSDLITVQNNRLFSMDSTGRDQSLRIWDIDEGQCLVVFNPESPIDCCQLSVRGDALVCGFAGETRLSTLHMNKNEKRKERRRSSKSQYIFDEPPSRKSSS